MEYRLLPGGYIDGTGFHRGVPPTEEDYLRVSLLMAHRMLFGPYDAEIFQELPVEEIKKRYPGAEVKE